MYTVNRVVQVDERSTMATDGVTSSASGCKGDDIKSQRRRHLRTTLLKAIISTIHNLVHINSQCERVEFETRMFVMRGGNYSQ